MSLSKPGRIASILTPATDPGQPPIILARQGCFYAGGRLRTSSVPASFHAGIPGRPDYDTPGTIRVDHAYVEYQVPVDARPTPILMVGGGCHLGNLYDETPDGREGWRTLGVRAGYAVCVVDPPRRGRSPFDPTTILEVRRGGLPPDSLPMLTTLTAETNWPMTRIGPILGTPYPDVQFPVDHFDGYMARIAPDWDLPDLRSETIFQALVGVLEAAGPSIVITHSATVTVGWMVVRRRPDLVRAHIAVEGGGGRSMPSRRPAEARRLSMQR